MDSLGEISSSEDEFDLELLRFETDCVHEDISEEEDESSDEESQKIGILESESDDECSKWTPCEDPEKVPPRMKFVSGERPAGPNLPENLERPLDFFKLFFTEELINRIVTETNSYAAIKLGGRTLPSHSVWKSWRDVTKEEFLAFLAVVVNMGTMPLPSLQEYWSKKQTSHIPFYPNTFTRDRFTQIFWMLHVKLVPGREANPTTRLQLINGYLDYINSSLLNHFTPGKEICVNESIVKLDGKISFVTHNPRKPTKWGIRMYTLVDSNTGYVCGILPYYGHITSETMTVPSNLPTSVKIPLHLYVQMLRKIPAAQGHHMFTDRYWTSCTLADELRKLKCHLTGKMSKKEVPESLTRSNFRKNSVKAYRRSNNLVLQWKDRKVVTLLTNWHGAEIATAERIHKHGVRTVVKKPEVVMSYAKFKAGSKDRYAATYCFMKKSLKWWRKLFFWGLEICLINSYILYKSVKKQAEQKPVGRLQFRKTLVDQLRGDFRQRRDRTSATSVVDHDEIRLDGKLHLMLTGTKKDCKVCSRRSMAGGRRETTYYCDTCPDKPRMHLGECFNKYHTKQKYRN